MRSTNTVLVIGNDRELLRLRLRILTAAGFDVQEAATDEEIATILLADAPAVVVVCRTLRDDQLTCVLQLLDREAHRPKLLLMLRTTDNSHKRMMDAADDVLDGFDGPVKLIAAVKRLVA